MREVDDPVGLKGRGEETVVLNDHSLHRVLGRHEQGARAGDIHRGHVVEPALGSTKATPALVQPSRRFGSHRRRTSFRSAWASHHRLGDPEATTPRVVYTPAEPTSCLERWSRCREALRPNKPKGSIERSTVGTCLFRNRRNCPACSVILRSAAELFAAGAALHEVVELLERDVAPTDELRGQQAVRKRGGHLARVSAPVRARRCRGNLPIVRWRYLAIIGAPQFTREIARGMSA